MLGFVEGRLGIDDPGFVGRKAGHQTIEGRRAQFRESAILLMLSQGIQHLSPQQPPHCLYVKDKILTNMNEALSIERKSACRGQYMNMGVEAQIAGPRMEHHRKAQSGFQPRPPEFQQQFADATE